MSNELKNKIRQSFNKAHQTYDEHCALQADINQKTFAMLAGFSTQFNTIADFACGTGLSTQHLRNFLAYNAMYAIDLSDKLIEVAQTKFLPHEVQFKIADFDERIFPNDYLDLIFCNMGLQWSLDLSNTIQLLSEYLTAQGLLLFSLPIHGTFPELNSNFKNTFHTAEAIQQYLESHKLRVVASRIESFEEKFSDQRAALFSLRAVGANCSLNKNETSNKKFQLNEIFVDDSATLTYQIGFFLAQKS